MLLLLRDINDEIMKAISRSSAKFSKKKKSKNKRINGELEQQEGRIASDVCETSVTSQQLTQQFSNLDLQSSLQKSIVVTEEAGLCTSNKKETKVKSDSILEDVEKLSGKPLRRNIRKELVLRDLSSTSSSMTSVTDTGTVKVKILGSEKERSREAEDFEIKVPGLKEESSNKQNIKVESSSTVLQQTTKRKRWEKLTQSFVQESIIVREDTNAYTDNKEDTKVVSGDVITSYDKPSRRSDRKLKDAKEDLVSDVSKNYIQTVKIALLDIKSMQKSKTSCVASHEETVNQSQNLEDKYLIEGAKPKVCVSQASSSVVSCSKKLGVISLKEEGSSQERVCGDIKGGKVKSSAVPEGTMRLSDKPLRRNIRKKLVLRDLSSTNSSITSASYADSVKVTVLGLKEESSNGQDGKTCCLKDEELPQGQGKVTEISEMVGSVTHSGIDAGLSSTKLTTNTMEGGGGS